MEWMPIETNPRIDGVEFLGYSSRVGKCDVFRWSAHWKHFETVQHDGEYGPDPDEVGIFDDLTHWMPFPSRLTPHRPHKPKHRKPHRKAHPVDGEPHGGVRPVKE